MKAIQPIAHDGGARLAVVAGPAAQPGDHPSREGQVVGRMGVLLLDGLACELARESLQERPVVGCKAILNALSRAAVTRLDQLHDAHRGDGGKAGEGDEGAWLLDLHRLDVEAGTL